MKRFILWFIAAAVLPAVSLAQPRAPISYSYVELTASTHQVEITSNNTEDAKGGGFSASYEVMPFLHVFGGYQTSEFDSFDLEADFLQAGVGAHHDFTDTKSGFLNVSAIKAEATLTDPMLGSVTSDNDGYGISLGYREINQTPMEFQLSIDYVNFDVPGGGSTSDTTMSVGLQYAFTPRLKMLGAFQFGGDEDVFELGVRYYWAARSSE
jgi:hypothetical protein